MTESDCGIMMFHYFHVLFAFISLSFLSPGKFAFQEVSEILKEFFKQGQQKSPKETMLELSHRFQVPEEFRCFYPLMKPSEKPNQ